MLDGLIAVFVVHATYNLIALGMVIVKEQLKTSPSPRALHRRPSTA